MSPVPALQTPANLVDSSEKDVATDAAPPKPKPKGKSRQTTQKTARAKTKQKQKGKSPKSPKTNPKGHTPSLNGHSGPSAADRRIKVVQALRKLGATIASAAVGLAQVAKKTGLDQMAVYHAVSGGSGTAGSSPTCLLATGHVKTAAAEGVRGVAVYLTKKGQDADLKQMSAPKTK